MAALDAHQAFWRKAERHVFASPRRRKIEDISIENRCHLKANEVRWIDLPHRDTCIPHAIGSKARIYPMS
jgi:hypothetical protein